MHNRTQGLMTCPSFFFLFFNVLALGYCQEKNVNDKDGLKSNKWAESNTEIVINQSGLVKISRE